ncbi:MAG: hypothetical protein R2939_13750 [Kofleriaceae bacterium]
MVRDLYRSSARRLEPLYAELLADLAADARTWFHHARTLSVAVRRVGEFAAGERQLIGTVKNAFVDAMAARGHHFTIDAAAPDLPLVVRLDDDGSVVVSLDLGGASLSQRGWRREQGAAPLREHLAAVMLMLARFDPRHDVLVDPMCGAGTIAIEGVLAARAPARPLTAAGRALSPRPCTDALFADAQPVVIAGDADLDALLAAKANLAAAGVVDDVVLRRADARRLDRGELAALAGERGRRADRGLVLCNPPYGERLGGDELLELYADLGDACRRLGAGWRGGFLVANPDFERAFGPPPRIKKPLSNGNLRAYFFLYDF